MDCKNNNFNGFDIPGGFQSMYPELFVIVGEIIGNSLAGKLPFNVQNALGNWLELVGQVLLTYNAQQQYFEYGPGNDFSPDNYNKYNDDSKDKEDECNRRKTIEELEEDIQNLSDELKKISDSIRKFKDEK